MSSQTEPDTQTRWTEGIVLFGILLVGVGMVQDLLPASPMLGNCILMFYLGINLALLFRSSSSKNDSDDKKAITSTLPYFQFQYQQELERAQKNRKSPIWKSPEGPYALYSKVTLAFLVISILVLGLILAQMRHFEDSLFRTLGCICALMTFITALKIIKVYSHTAPTLLYKPLSPPSGKEELYRKSYGLFGLVYCFYAIALMSHLL